MAGQPPRGPEPDAPAVTARTVIETHAVCHSARWRSSAAAESVIAFCTKAPFWRSSAPDISVERSGGRRRYGRLLGHQFVVLAVGGDSHAGTTMRALTCSAHHHRPTCRRNRSRQARRRSALGRHLCPAQQYTHQPIAGSAAISRSAAGGSVPHRKGTDAHAADLPLIRCCDPRSCLLSSSRRSSLQAGFLQLPQIAAPKKVLRHLRTALGSSAP